ncbi:hypothetical protein CTZ27_03010 [Streptomyces griseocarneus]|nr:hypothetical protein CTZ27_03010 [Streptomyces griseocarneus]
MESSTVPEKVELDWGYLAELADRVARHIAGRWPIVEKDDVKQSILEHALNYRQTIEEHYQKEDFLWKIFRKAGIQYAVQERNYADLVDDQYYYTPDEAKAALRSFLYTDDELGQMIGKHDDLLSTRVTDSLVSARLDAANALKKLDERQQALLMTRYVYGLPVTEQTERQALSRAVVALSQRMNWSLRTKANAA